MLYLLDANVPIDANRDYYPLSRVPEFWAWLEYSGANGLVKMPIEIYEEVDDGDDDLAKWARRPNVRTALLLEEQVDPTIVARVVDEGYGSDLTDVEVEEIGRDPFLVAYALHDPSNRCVVTTEVSKPGRSRAHRHLPDVCDDLGVTRINTFGFVRDLNFTTGWRES